MPNLITDNTFTDMLVDTFTPQTVTRTADGQGGYTDAWTDGTDFSGRLSILTTAEMMLEDKETASATYKIFCETSVDVDADDLVKLSLRTFKVLGVQRPSNLTTDGHLEIKVLEVDYDL